MICVRGILFGVSDDTRKREGESVSDGEGLWCKRTLASKEGAGRRERETNWSENCHTLQVRYRQDAIDVPRSLIYKKRECTFRRCTAMSTLRGEFWSKHAVMSVDKRTRTAAVLHPQRARAHQEERTHSDSAHFFFFQKRTLSRTEESEKRGIRFKKGESERKKERKQNNRTVVHNNT